MSIRAKILIALIGTILALFAVLFIIYQTVVLESYKTLEEATVKKDVERVIHALHREAEQMESLNFDWATWDDTYEFVHDLNFRYPQSNLSNETFIKQKINLMLFVNGSGKPVYWKAFDLGTNKEAAFPEDLKFHISDGALSNRPNGSLTILSLSSGFMLVTSKPIMTSQNTGSARGILIMGRWIDPLWTKNFSQTLRAPISILAGKGFDLAEFGPHDGIAVKGISEEKIAGYAFLRDIDNKPVIARIELPRMIYSHGKINANYFMLYFLVTSLVVCAISIVIIEKLILSRLSVLSRSIVSIGSKADVSMRVGGAVNGSDEVACLAKGVDHMLDSIEILQIETREAMNALRISEERLSSVLETHSDIVWETDNELVCTYVSPTVLHMLDYEPSILVGKPIFFTMEPGEESYFMECLSSASVSGKPFRIETKMRRRDGSTIPSEVCASIVYGPNRTILGYRGINRDISDKINAEAAKEEIRSVLVRAQKMEVVGKLASGVAHDFNNILAIIKALCNLGLEAQNRKESPLEYLELIAMASDRATGLTRQLLLFSRSKPIKHQSLFMNDVLMGIHGMLTALVGENITIKTCLDPRLWRINADRGAIEQIIINLVINAKDAMPQGGSIHITTMNEAPANTDNSSVEMRSRRIMVAIMDTGCGMDEEVQKNIFEPFFTTKKDSKGIGMGLAVTQDIIKEHGGEIRVYSSLGAGSEFRLFLQAHQVEDHQDLSPARQRHHYHLGGGETILIVEDESMLRKSVSLVLSRCGFQVLEADGVKDAVEIFDNLNGGVHLVFSDVILKDRSGVDLASELIRRKPDVKILFTSGYMDIESQWNFIKENGFHFLQKPYEIPELLEKVSGILRQSPDSPCRNSKKA